jgi:hypothetical protein
MYDFCGAAASMFAKRLLPFQTKGEAIQRLGWRVFIAILAHPSAGLDARRPGNDEVGDGVPQQALL